MENLIVDYFSKYGLLKDYEIQEFIDLTVVEKIYKNDYFIREGQICNKVAFINSGIFRSYYSTDKDDEYTYCFTFPGNLLTAYSSYLSSEPTVENIQAVIDAELLVISASALKNLEKKSISWTLLFKYIAEQQYMELEKRIFQLQSTDALNRYLHLIEHNAEYIEKVPLIHLASYLGISQRHLSRIRKTIKY